MIEILNKNKQKIILGIETSCDETSVAIYKNGQVIDELTTSSSCIQANFGGVVPEVATRYHQHNVHIITQKILARNNLLPSELTHIAYTNTPGLPGCLHVGSCFAFTLANLLQIPLIPINHLYGHLFSPFINSNEEAPFPMLSLVISGGHTSIYLAHSYTEIIVLNETQDDAVGEVYDKVARALGFAYPGGPKIDKLFNENHATLQLLKNNFPADKPFSFSGIKTATLNYINMQNQKHLPVDISTIASSFQKTIINEVIHKLDYYLKLYKVKNLSLGGGVAANNYLRHKVQTLPVDNLYISPLKYTGDQASMIVWYAAQLIKD